jgi:hypothetical protein
MERRPNMEFSPFSKKNSISELSTPSYRQSGSPYRINTNYKFNNGNKKIFTLKELTHECNRCKWFSDKMRNLKHHSPVHRGQPHEYTYDDGISKFRIFENRVCTPTEDQNILNIQIIWKVIFP